MFQFKPKWAPPGRVEREMWGLVLSADAEDGQGADAGSAAGTGEIERRRAASETSPVDMPQEGTDTPVRGPQERRWRKEEQRFCRARWT